MNIPAKPMTYSQAKYAVTKMTDEQQERVSQLNSQSIKSIAEQRRPTAQDYQTTYIEAVTQTQLENGR